MIAAGGKRLMIVVNHGHLWALLAEAVGYGGQADCVKQSPCRCLSVVDSRILG